jgi:hypothetical protein
MWDWPGSTWALLGGILKRVYFWVLPFVFLQPVDLLEKVGVDLVIPDQVVYGLVALGVFASGVDVVREQRAKVRGFEQLSDARQVAGSLFVEPMMAAHSDRKNRQALIHPQIRVHNRSQRAIAFRMVALTCSVDGKGLEPMEEDETPTTISPTDYMDTSGFVAGPYAVGTRLEIRLDLQVEYGLPWAQPSVLESKVFTFLARITAPDQYSASDWSLEQESRELLPMGKGRKR